MIRSLSIFPAKNREKIISLGIKYGVVTEHTSLVVMTELSQYQKHKVCPPKQLKELRKLYLNEIEKQEIEEGERRKKKLEEVVEKWNGRKEWHKQNFIQSSSEEESSPPHEPIICVEERNVPVEEETGLDEETVILAREEHNDIVQSVVEEVVHPQETSTSRSDNVILDGQVSLDDTVCSEPQPTLEQRDEDVNGLVACVENTSIETAVGSSEIPPANIESNESNEPEEVIEQHTSDVDVEQANSVESDENLSAIDQRLRQRHIGDRRDEEHVVNSNKLSWCARPKAIFGKRRKSRLDQKSINEKCESASSFFFEDGRTMKAPNYDEVDEKYFVPKDYYTGSGSTMRSNKRLLASELMNALMVHRRGCPSKKRTISSMAPQVDQPGTTGSFSSSIKVKAFQPNSEYIQKISSSPSPYEEYLVQKQRFEDSPSFFLDCADYFLKKEETKEIGIRVLSNIVELELNNPQLFRIMGYRLQQAKKYDEAIDTFEKVLKMKAEEPQSYRDLALVLLEVGELNRAAGLMVEVILGKWDRRFYEIEQTAVIELNHILNHFEDEEESKEVIRKLKIDERLLYNMDVDFRVSMAWDTDQTDIDLHVYDPSGEHCYYSNKRTTSGGFISRDFTRGYGPEEFMQKKAQNGQFRIAAKYYSSHQQSLSGGTTILCSFFTNFLRDNEEKQLVTVRLNKSKEEIDVCEIEF